MLGNSQVIQRATRATTALPSIVLNSYVYDIIHIVLLRRSTCRDDHSLFSLLFTSSNIAIKEGLNSLFFLINSRKARLLQTMQNCAQLLGKTLCPRTTNRTTRFSIGGSAW